MLSSTSTHRISRWAPGICLRRHPADIYLKLRCRSVHSTAGLPEPGLRKLTPLDTKRIAQKHAPQVKLPPRDQWVKAIGALLTHKPLQGRISINNPETAAKMANALIPEGAKDKVIVEAYPGPGELTRALLNLPRERIRKIIVLESIAEFSDWLDPLAEVDDRITVLKMDPYDWATYETMITDGHLSDVPVLDWDAGVHPQLHFIQHLPSIVMGEQLLNQYVRTMPDRHWFFKYGRVTLDLICSTRMHQRLTYPPGNSNRGKIGVLCETAAELSVPLAHEEMFPYNDHFFPPTTEKGLSLTGAKSNTMSRRSVGFPHSVLRLVPLENQAIKPRELDIWDFVLRKLFISKATPVAKAIPTLAPGAASILKTLTDPSKPADQRLDVKKTPRELLIPEWRLIVDAFQQWPFRPANMNIEADLLPQVRK
ncbi:S-adenosyl-L-methionine-dependent methyltransferase [Coprinopsis marcescibilis]|uniref:rRNA adenine N(6)-methyltransferase n=1 Tax=Coprinopsis marcescibilis TaxID=230819 RepID=A0A5C3KKP8_COPMA|nr:S-adenosyl-L-methionine-dependent methyltransferase [Coprinopsis marcescibilis]